MKATCMNWTIEGTPAEIIQVIQSMEEHRKGPYTPFKHPQWPYWYGTTTNGTVTMTGTAAMTNGNG